METTIENRIREAAKEIFLKKGYKETSMSDIAAEVGITRTAMHYYFRTKERLFQAVFGEIIQDFLPKIKGIIVSDATLEEKLRSIVMTYYNVLLKMPELPVFLMKEVNRDAENLLLIAQDNEIMEMAKAVFDGVTQEIVKGRMKNVPILEIIYTFYGLMMFPFLSLPIARQVCAPKYIEEELNEKWKEKIVSQLLHLLSPETAD